MYLKASKELIFLLEFNMSLLDSTFCRKYKVDSLKGQFTHKSNFTPYQFTIVSMEHLHKHFMEDMSEELIWDIFYLSELSL